MSDESKESIWQPLDGSAPQWTQPAAAPSAFRKPESKPLGLPGVGASAAAAPAAAPVDGGSGRAVYMLGSWGQRFGAWLIDAIAFGVVLLGLSVLGAMANGLTAQEALEFFSGQERAPSGVDATPLWVITGLQLVLQGILPAIFLARWNGQTPGKRLVGLRVVREGGEPMTFALALKREFVAKVLFVGAIGGLTFGIVFLANYLWPLRDAQNRAGHDFYAKSRVVVAPKE